jgi:hypothetical protein
MKTLGIATLLVAGIALICALSLASPAAAAVGNPVGAPYIDIQTHSIPGSSSLWYRFNYAGDHSQMSITIPLGADNGLAFEVYTPAQTVSWWDTEPLGRGTAKGADLFWTGNSHAGGTYSLKIINDNPHAVGFQVKVEGDGVSITAPSTAPVLVVPVAAAPAPANADPGKAVTLPASAQGVPAKGSVWYRFYFDGGNDALVKLTLPYGDYNHLKFELYAPGQMAKWWEADPIGRGSASGDDLFWAGDLYISGTYYLRVVNNNPAGVGFELKIEHLRH